MARSPGTEGRTRIMECVQAFAGSCGVGCVLSDAQGTVLQESGYSCSSCGLCRAVNRSTRDCLQSQKSLFHAQSPLGKYIRFCPLGLTCLVSPIPGDAAHQTRLTAGPCLLMDRKDYMAGALVHAKALSSSMRDRALAALKHVPEISPEQLTHMSTLLCILANFLGDPELLNSPVSPSTPTHIEIAAEVKPFPLEASAVPYPFDKEQALLRAVKQGDRKEAVSLLNQLWVNILLASGGALGQVKSRISELLILISRAAAATGADPDYGLRISERYAREMTNILDYDTLCLWLFQAVNELMDSVFDFSATPHAQVIQQSIQHINAHFDQRLTLDEMARRVYLSPAYFSRIFKEDVGETFVNYLNRVRVDHSLVLLRQKNLRLADIALRVGFEDQSYFTKVFKKVTGLPPQRYRDSLED